MSDKIEFQTKVDYVVKHIWPSGAISIVGHHTNEKNAITEAKFRHAKEPKKKYAVSRITDEEIYTIY